MLKSKVFQFFIVIILISITGVVKGQEDSSHWEADLIVRHPSGNRDTLTFGVDVDGGVGYQNGLDEIDTNFTTPISIRSHDPRWFKITILATPI